MSRSRVVTSLLFAAWLFAWLPSALGGAETSSLRSQDLANARAESGSVVRSWPLWLGLGLLALGGWGALRLRRLHQRLRDSQRTYDYLANNSVDMIWIVAPDLRPTYVSPSVSWFLGYSPEEFGDGLSRICGPVFCDKLQEIFTVEAEDLRSKIGHGAATSFDMELLRKDGSRVWSEIFVSPARGEQGNGGFVCVIRDIHTRKEAENSLTDMSLRFRKLIDAQADPLLILGMDRRVRFANKVALALFKVHGEELLGSEFPWPTEPDTIKELSVTAPSGDERILEMRVNALHWEGKPSLFVSMRNITESKRMQTALKQSEERYRTVADYTYGCETWIGPDGKFLYLSPSCAELTGYPQENFSGGAATLERIVHPDDLALWRQHLDKSKLIDGDTLDFRIFRQDGKIRWISAVSRIVAGGEGAALGLRCSLRDITERKLMEEQLRRHALHDGLTGIGNRTLCLDRILQGLERSKRRDDYFYAVVFLGLDRFKYVNESMGHAFGDKVLVEVSRRLTGCVRDLDTVSRFGGDEFVIFLEELNSPREATHVVKRVCDVIRAPYVFDGRQVQLTASLGVVLSPADYNSPEDLLRNATIAMYRAKEAGRDRFKIFNSKMLERAVQVMNLENEVRRAIVNNEFFLVFQPVVRLKAESLIGFEALLRWNRPGRGVVGPGEFIPLAEETGLIVDIGRFVLEEACVTLSSWRKTLPWAANLQLSINISGKQFSQAGLVDLVRRTLGAADLPASSLKLEITETAIMDNAEQAIERLFRLKNLGLTLSIDDFGTGYSSMSYLQKFPLDNLKIDLSFVRMMEIAPENVEIVKAIIDLAHNLGLEVVAEGVENVLQKQLLTRLGCEYGQGYLFARPLEKEQAMELIRREEAKWSGQTPSVAA
jgi:diguanylate cyclase (GGDEF)-like protein/PAS domain S-box-containing protein